MLPKSTLSSLFDRLCLMVDGVHSYVSLPMRKYVDHMPKYTPQILALHHGLELLTSLLMGYQMVIRCAVPIQSECSMCAKLWYIGWTASKSWDFWVFIASRFARRLSECIITHAFEIIWNLAKWHEANEYSTLIHQLPIELVIPLNEFQLLLQQLVQGHHAMLKSCRDRVTNAC